MFSLVAKLLGSTWNSSQTVRPDIQHPLSVYRIEYRTCWSVRTLDGIPWGCAPPLANYCALVIPLLESSCMCLKLSALVSFVMGRKGFPGFGQVNSLEPWISLPTCCALTGQLLRPRWFLCQNLVSNFSKGAPCLPLNWFGRESMDYPWLGQAKPLCLLNSHALNLDKCA
jgi:hypothetical protein